MYSAKLYFGDALILNNITFVTNSYIQDFIQINTARVCISLSVAFELYGLFQMIDCFLSSVRFLDRRVIEPNLSSLFSFLDGSVQDIAETFTWRGYPNFIF